MLLLRTTAVLTSFTSSLALRVPITRTWDDLVHQDPDVKSLLLYCDLIKESQSGCASKFVGLNSHVGGSTAVAREAAATCLQRQHLDSTPVLMNMFNVDMNKMSNYASGPVLNAPPKNYHWGWSEEAKREAARKASEIQNKENRMRRDIEHSNSKWDKLFPADRETEAAERLILIGESVADQGLDIWAASKAYNDPWSVGVPPDQVIPNQATSGASPPSDSPTPDSPTPDSPPPNNPTSDSPPLDNPTPDNPPDNPPPEDVTSETVFPQDVSVDLTDEINATPVLHDEMTRTAMQQCQESVEAELWADIGSKTPHPNTQTPGEEKQEAEYLMLFGICDKYYYGEKVCAEKKKNLQVIPLDPDSKATMDEYIKAHPLCPVNLLSENDCHKAKQELFKHYDVPDPEMETVTSMFKPGKAVPWLPRPDLHLIRGKDAFRPEMPSFKTKKDVPILFSPDGKLLHSKHQPGSRAPQKIHEQGEGSSHDEL
jgi:hypothetical protein